MIELYLNNVKVDLNDSDVVQTFQINDIGSIDDRQANYTNRFKLPFTPKNITVLNYLKVLGNSSKKPYQKISARLIEDGITRISNGTARITKSSDNFEVVIYDGNYGLLKDISSLTLQDIDYSSLNHYITKLMLLDSHNSNERYIYALADFGIGIDSNANQPPDAHIKLAMIAPSLFIHTIFDLIIEQAGYSRFGDFFSDTQYRNEVFGLTKGNITPNSTSQTLSNQLNITSNNSISLNYATRRDVIINLSLNSNNSSTGFTALNGKIQSLFTGLAQINITVNYNLIEGEVKIYFLKNGSPFYFYTLEKGNSQTKQMFSNVDVIPEDEISIEIIGKYDRYNKKTDFDITSFSGTISELSYGQYIDFSLYTPDTKQSDFIKDVMQRYGLVFRNTDEKEYEFKRIETVLTDYSNAEDWSDKYVENIDESYSLGSFAKKNYLNFQNGRYSSYSSVFEIDNYYLQNEEKDIITSIYKVGEYLKDPSNSLITINGAAIMDIPLRELIGNGSFIFSNIKNNDIDLFIYDLFYRNIDLYTEYLDEGGSIHDITTQKSTPFLSKSFTSFTHYFNNNYKAYARLLNNSVVRNDYYNLTLKDIINLDFFTIKYNKHLGHYYYLNKISQYKKGRPSKCEVVQVNPIYIQEKNGGGGTSY